MQRAKQEIEEELSHQREMLKIRLEQRRILEKQVAQFGIDVPIHLLNQLNSLAAYINSHEEDIIKLETLVAEDRLSLAEAEYRALLAELWDTPSGNPSVAGSTKLELARLRLGLLPEKAQALENEIREALAEQAFASIDIDILWSLDLSKFNMSTPQAEELRSIGKCIRLHSPVALRLLKSSTPNERKLNMQLFSYLLMSSNKVWSRLHEQPLFEAFINEFTQASNEAE